MLYIDIGFERPKSVEGAFDFTDSVLTLSFHHGGDFESGEGKMYSLNVPLQAGIFDDAYRSVYKPIVTELMSVYKPEVVVLQSGTDSIAGDHLEPQTHSPSIEV